MTISAIDPLRDARWSTFVLQHPAATVFHTPEWLCALKKTYGFTPVAVVSTDSDGTIDNGIPFCEVSSWATGRRLVSLPFSDHCEPLIRDDAALECILAFARDYSQ